MPKILILTAAGVKNFSSSDQKRLRRLGDIHFRAQKTVLTLDQCKTLLRSVEYLAVTHRSLPVVDGDILALAPRLRGVALFATGLDRVDEKAFAQRRIRLYRLEHYSTETVAEQ